MKITPLESIRERISGSAYIKKLGELFDSRPETGTRITPMIDGETIFPEAKDMIENSKSLIQLEMYSLTHKEMVDLMCRKAKEGVTVQVITDPKPGTSPKEEAAKRSAVEKLTASGAEVHYYPTNQAKYQIDHVKLLLVDGQTALMGGMNWSGHSPVNHDADIKLEGPAVNYYRTIFAAGWKKVGGAPIPETPKPHRIPGGKAEVRGITTENYKYTGINDAVLFNINKAMKSIHIESFILSDRQVIKSLLAARERGVEIKAILDPTLVGTQFSSNDRTFTQLKKAGVDVKWYDVDTSQQQKLHAKWATFDGKEMIIGSANWTRQGLNINRELGADVKDRPTVKAFDKQFARDWKTRTADKLPEIDYHYD